MFGFGRPRRPRLVAFDVIGTLFPLDPLRPLYTALGLPGGAVELVYSVTLRDSFALSAIGDYQPFKVVMATALDEVLALHGLDPSQAARSRALQGMKYLTPRPDAATAFRALRHAGLGVAVLSNGKRQDTAALLDRNGLGPLVDLVASAEDAGLSKPRPEVYAHLARRAGIRARHIAMVAIHAWDTNGAAAAGLTTAYVSAEQPLSRVMRRPDVQARTLLEAVHALIDL